MANLTIRSTELERTPTGRAIALVDVVGPRGGLQEFTVHLTRKGNVDCAVRTFPTQEFYSKPNGIPSQIVNAAWKAWQGAAAAEYQVHGWCFGRHYGSPRPDQLRRRYGNPGLATARFSAGVLPPPPAPHRLPSGTA